LLESPLVTEDALMDVYWDRSSTEKLLAEQQIWKLVVRSWDLKTGKEREPKTLVQQKNQPYSLMTQDRRHVLFRANSSAPWRVCAGVRGTGTDLPLDSGFNEGNVPSIVGARLY